VNMMGNLAVTSAGAITEGGALSVAGTSSFTTTANNASIILTNANNALSGAVSLTPNGFGAADLVNTVPTTLFSGTGTFGGTVTVTAATLDLAASNIAGNLTLVTDSLGGVGTVTLPGTLTIEPFTANSNTNLLGGGAGLDLSAAQLGRFQGYSTLSVGSSGSGVLTVANPLTLPGNANLQLVSGAGGIQVPNSLTVSGTGTLTLNGSGGVNVSATLTSGAGGISISGPTTLNGTIQTAGGAVSISGSAQLNGTIQTAGAGAVSISGPTTLNGTIQTAGGAVSISGPTQLNGAIQTAAGAVSLLGNVALAGSSTINSANGAPAGNNILFAGTVDGPGQALTLNAGTAGTITFDQAVGGSGLPNQLGPLVMVGQSITGGAFNVASFTFNAPVLNAGGVITGLGGLAAAHQVDDLAVTTNQFFNGFQLGPTLPPLAPPSTTTNGISNSVNSQFGSAPSADSTSIGGDIGAGFEVSISAHNVDWDDPIEDLPIKPVDYLLDLSDYFSGKRAQGGSSSQAASPSEERPNPCVAPTSDDKSCTRP